MRKSIPALRQAEYESISDLPRIQKSYRKKALVVIPPAMRIFVTSNGEQRVQVLIPVVQGLSQKQRQFMQQYFELVDWQGLKLPSAERRQREKPSSRNHGEEIYHDPCHAKFVALAAGHQLKPEHPPVGNHSCTTGNRSRNE